MSTKAEQRRAAEVLREYASMVESSEMHHSGPMKGKLDADAQAEVDEYRALAGALETPPLDQSAPAAGTHRQLTWIPCSQDGLWECADCKHTYCSPPWTSEKVLKEPCERAALLAEFEQWRATREEWDYELAIAAWIESRGRARPTEERKS